jgi:hypothetical protein
MQYTTVEMVTVWVWSEEVTEFGSGVYSDCYWGEGC